MPAGDRHRAPRESETRARRAARCGWAAGSLLASASLAVASRAPLLSGLTARTDQIVRGLTPRRRPRGTTRPANHRPATMTIPTTTRQVVSAFTSSNNRVDMDARKGNRWCARRTIGRGA
jgi:hypothetical protein